MGIPVGSGLFGGAAAGLAGGLFGPGASSGPAGSFFGNAASSSRFAVPRQPS